MKTKTENKSFIRAWKLNMRALKLLHGEMPGWFTATILNGLLTAAAPYAAIWFSARLIAELCGGRDVNVLTRCYFDIGKHRAAYAAEGHGSAPGGSGG